MGTTFTPHDQNRRLFRLATPLGENALIPTEVHGEEAVSDDFRYLVNAFSETHHDIAPDEIVGQPVTVTIVGEEGADRYLNGFVQSLETLGRTRAGQRSAYRFTLASALAFLEKRTNCRVFQRRTIPGVIGAILRPLTTQG
ncbi:MAG TPA: contractile injection system protein, VgrG/Pvc8 family, partial [Gammaproteobacteria bacterium]|nr:contractile injection system protein, VgrG/Pvc8 family [Gammaproteobacteria bacterium]